ncbi:large ribosomal subunit protein uL18m-like [Haliotis asinina]|uniref:large ribosomal subunit protein uL18m-like n=1 Tax=Haliotis asinina TaxID=109174 RepID=UPI00353249DF
MLTRLSRVVCPAWIDTGSFSCTTTWRQRIQAFGSTAMRCVDDGPNKDFKVNPVFLNRNPRNLESMGIARKRQGWILQYPRKNYYHKLFFERSARHTSAWVEHMNGETVVSASTREWAVQEQLYSTSDVSAAENIGRVLAQRCVECGLTSVFYDKTEDNTPSESREVFLKAVQDVVTLMEPRQLKPRYEPGIDYDRPNRYGEKKKLKPDYQIS